MIIHNTSGISKCTKYTIENPEELDPEFTRNLLSPPRSTKNKTHESPIDSLREDLQRENVKSHSHIHHRHSNSLLQQVHIKRVIIETIETGPEASKFLGSLGPIERGPEPNKNILGSLGHVDSLKSSGVIESKYKGPTSSYYPKAVDRVQPEEKKEGLPAASTFKPVFDLYI